MPTRCPGSFGEEIQWAGEEISTPKEKKRFYHNRKYETSTDGIPGRSVRAKTVLGNEVRGWKGGKHCAPTLRYFCHGHTLATYENDGYSVCSGIDMQTVLNDEWNLLCESNDGGLEPFAARAETNPEIPKIVVFYLDGNPVHSARVKEVSSGSVRVTSKNGPGDLVLCDLTKLAPAYRHDNIRLYESNCKLHNRNYLTRKNGDVKTNQFTVAGILAKMEQGLKSATT